MSDHSDLPFKAEYAKSGRAGCKACKENIAQHSLRLAVMVQSPIFDGKMPNWYHFACFWKRARPETEDEIHGFHSLRWDDQQKIKEKIAAATDDSGDSKGMVNIYNDYTAEYAKSNRSTCRICDQKIEKDAVRVSKKDYESQRSKMHGPQDLWHHMDCFVDNRDKLGFRRDLNTERIVGFGKLKKEDQDTLLEKLGKGEQKKRKAGEEKGASAGGKKAKKEESEEDKRLKRFVKS